MSIEENEESVRCDNIDCLVRRYFAATGREGDEKEKKLSTLSLTARYK